MHALVQGASRGIGLAFVEVLLARGEVGRVVATCRDPEASASLRALRSRDPRLEVQRLDVRDEGSIAAAARAVGEACGRLHLLVNCAGVLHEGDALQPEKKLEHLRPEALRRAFEVNAVGPVLVAKHFWPLLRHEERAVLASLSARVGSIGDNRLGGWYGYRASKAAQNMFTRTLAREMRRRAPRLICVALHPGTVDTDLSRPFQGGVPQEERLAPEQAARRLLAVVDSLEREESGSFLDGDRKPVPW